MATTLRLHYQISVFRNMGRGTRTPIHEPNTYLSGDVGDVTFNRMRMRSKPPLPRKRPTYTAEFKAEAAFSGANRNPLETAAAL